jgi:hypothetical protein
MRKNKKRKKIKKEEEEKRGGVGGRRITLSVPNYRPSVIRVTLVASKVFTHNCAT